MDHRYLTPDEVHEFVENSLVQNCSNSQRMCSWDYIDKVNSSTRYTSFPGGDIGYLCVLAIAANRYGFEIDLDKAMCKLISDVGGKEQLSFIVERGSSLYNNTIFGYMDCPDSIDTIGKDACKQIRGSLCKICPDIDLGFKKAKKTMANAAAIIEGDYGINPEHIFTRNNQCFQSTILAIQRSGSRSRHRFFCESLISENAVKLYEGFDSEYLFECLEESSEILFYDYIHYLDSNLPIFHVNVSLEKEIQVESYS